MRLRKFIGGVLGDVGKARQQPAIVIKLTLPKIDFFLFLFLAKILLGIVVMTMCIDRKVLSYV
jgi:hypothetical protein